MLKRHYLIWLTSVILIFMIVSGLLDYWQAAMEHGYRLPPFLKDYHAWWWLILHNGLLPLLLVATASRFNRRIILTTIAASLIGYVLWDAVYSYLDTGRLFSDQIGYFYWQGQNFGLSAGQIMLWSGIRLAIAGIIFWKVKQSPQTLAASRETLI